MGHHSLLVVNTRCDDCRRLVAGEDDKTTTAASARRARRPKSEEEDTAMNAPLTRHAAADVHRRPLNTARSLAPLGSIRPAGRQPAPSSPSPEAGRSPAGRPPAPAGRTPAAAARATGAPGDDLAKIPRTLRNDAARLRAAAITAKREGDLAGAARAQEHMEALRKTAFTALRGNRTPEYWAEIQGGAGRLAVLTGVLGIAAAVFATTAPAGMGGVIGLAARALGALGGWGSALLIGLGPPVVLGLYAWLQGRAAARVQAAVETEFSIDGRGGR